MTSIGESGVERRFYELASWRLDGAVKEKTIVDTPIRELRYQLVL